MQVPAFGHKRLSLTEDGFGKLISSFAVSPQVMNVKEHTNEMVGQLDDKARSFWRWRAKSSSVLMVITHGKLAFLFQKNEMVEQLDNKSDPLLPHPGGPMLRLR